MDIRTCRISGRTLLFTSLIIRTCRISGRTLLLALLVIINPS